MTIEKALLQLELSGTWTPEAWPALRQALLATTDPQLAALAGPLRQLVEAKQAMIAAQQDVSRCATLVATATDPAQIEQHSRDLSLAAEELIARSGVVVSFGNQG